MPRHDVVSLVDGAWVQLTNGDVTKISFQLVQGAEVRIAGTVGATVPVVAGWKYANGQGEMNASMVDLFPGIAATRVWAQLIGGENGKVMVSHA